MNRHLEPDTFHAAHQLPQCFFSMAVPLLPLVEAASAYFLLAQILTPLFFFVHFAWGLMILHSKCCSILELGWRNQSAACCRNTHHLEKQMQTIQLSAQCSIDGMQHINVLLEGAVKCTDAIWNEVGVIIMQPLPKHAPCKIVVPLDLVLHLQHNRSRSMSVSNKNQHDCPERQRSSSRRGHRQV